jgi:hypothetical protein
MRKRERESEREREREKQEIGCYVWKNVDQVILRFNDILVKEDYCLLD